MNELFLAITLLCTKTNDLNMWAINSRKTCVADLLECVGNKPNSKKLAFCVRPKEKQ